MSISLQVQSEYNTFGFCQRLDLVTLRARTASEKLSPAQSEFALLDSDRAIYRAILQNRSDLQTNGGHRRARDSDGVTHGVQRWRNARDAGRTLSRQPRRGNVHSRSVPAYPLPRNGSALDRGN